MVSVFLITSCDFGLFDSYKATMKKVGLRGRSVCKMPSEGCWCVQTALLLFDFEVQPGDVPLFEVAEGFIEVADGRRMVADDNDFHAFHFGALN